MHPCSSVSYLGITLVARKLRSYHPWQVTIDPKGPRVVVFDEESMQQPGQMVAEDQVRKATY